MGIRDRSNHNGASQGRPARPRNMNALHPECRRMLLEAGFIYDDQRDAWSSRAAGRTIAFDHVAERSPEWLAGWLTRS